MQIILHPQDYGHLDPNKLTKISVSGMVVTVNGEAIDLSVIPEGGQPDE